MFDGLPGEFEQFVDRARAALSQEITAAKKLAAAARAETATAQATLSNLQAQTKSTQDQSAAVTNELQRLSDLAGIGHSIVKARAELKRVQSETEQATKALAALHKQRTEAEAKLVTLNNEAQRQLGIRREAEAAYADIKARVYSVQLGQRP